MSKFKVGDYVRVKKFKERPVGWAKDGTMDYLMGRIVLIIDVFETFKGTNTLLWICDEKSNTSHCVSTKWVEKENEAIVIYKKGNQVIALDKATGEKSIARCHPDDEFDFYIGAKLAFERLMGVSYGISVKEMREVLYKYCHGESKLCPDCALGGIEFRCGRGVHFKTKYPDGTYKMSDEEIRAAYKTVFGDKEKEEPKEEPQDFAKTMYEIRSDLEKAGFTKQESMDFVIRLTLKAMYPN